MGHWVWSVLVRSAFVAAALALATTPGRAAPASELVTGSPTPASSQAEPIAQDAGTPENPEARLVEDLKRKTRELREFAAGTLAPTIDPGPLLVVHVQDALGDPELGMLALLRRVEELRNKPLYVRRSALKAKLGDTQEPKQAARDLFDTRATFLSLPDKDRARILENHRERRREAETASQAVERDRQRLENLVGKAKALQAFLDGKLDPKLDPHELLRIDLGDVADVGSNELRRKDFLALGEQPPAPDGPPRTENEAETKAETKTAPASDVPDAPLQSQLEAAEKALDSLRYRILAVPAAELGRLLDVHGAQARKAESQPAAEEAAKQRIGEAEDRARQAAAEHRKAIEASKQARTEALRWVAERRARLLGVKEAQAQLDVRIAQRRPRIEKYRETSLGWSRRVRELEERAVLEGAAQADAGRLYNELVLELTTLRMRLRDTLSEIQSGNRGVPQPAAAQGDPVPTPIDDSELEALETELFRAAQSLKQKVDKLRWDLAGALRDGVVTMNQARLRLMPLLEPARRAALRGFGSDGVRQAGREFEQITLEARYHVLALPARLRAQAAGLRTSPLPALYSLLKLAVIVAAFRWWRRHADALLEKLQERWLARRPQTVWSRAIAALAWYARQVRRPIEWLLLAGAILNAVADVGTLPELEYVRIVVMWTLLGSFVVRLLHAIAGRQGELTRQATQLRFRSLQLVGVSVVVVGLILALAEASVGQGAIYGWVLRTCWLLALPVAALLTVWWRSTVIERAKLRSQQSGMFTWVSAHDRGPSSLLASAVGGVVLLVDGLYRFALRHASGLAITRRFLAYLFRREVERHAFLAPAAVDLEPIAEDLYTALGPETTSLTLVRDVAAASVERLNNLVRAENNAVTAVTGERGAGKTTVLRRVMAGLAPGELCQVDCESSSYHELLEKLARTLGLAPGVDEQTLARTIQQRGLKVICIDDVQRLVRPIIGGLEDIDRFIAFAHRVGASSSWLVAIGAPAWQYLRRARGDRATFDEVVALEPWDEKHVAQLVRQRCSDLSVAASFESLVVPRQLDAGQLTDAERTERDYYRILWSASLGNPAVALHLWRESLSRKKGTSELVVRLFKAPGVPTLENLPSSMHFVLRAIVQLERAIEPDIVQATGLRLADVTDALRVARARGIVEPVDGRLRIAVGWYRPVTQVLRRQHLLIM